MNQSNNSNRDDLDELLRQVDDLLAEPTPEEDEDIDIDQYAPNDIDEDPILYQNYSNHYGADLRNYANGYAGTEAAMPNSQPSTPSIPAYNADFLRQQKEDRRKNEHRNLDSEYRDYGVEENTMSRQAVRKAQKQPAPKKPRKKPGCGCGCLTVLIALVVAVVIAVNWLFAPPKSDASIGQRKRDTATILICGTDEDGTRTDTMMLMYLSGSERQVSLLSLPRDSYTITSAGSAAKLNSAYGRNGCGEEGMEGLLDYVQEIIGYRPDGYILVDFTIVPQIVDIMGGIDFDVSQEIYMGDVVLQPGMQHLDGTQVLALLRYRYGYATADLGRIQVQRQVIQACLKQWVSPSHISEALDSVRLIDSASISTLSLRNYLWMGKVVLTGMGNFRNDTLPGYADYIGDVSYYLLNRDEVANLINEAYNPYKVAISPSDLKIAG